MTRVNLVPVSDLYDQHLMAEYREIPMVVASLKRSLAANANDPSKLRIPPSFRLNAGHVSFFYNKGRWLYSRYCLVINELLARGFNIRPSERSVEWSLFLRHDLFETKWQPSNEDVALSKQRIDVRVAAKPNWYRMTKST